MFIDKLVPIVYLTRLSKKGERELTAPGCFDINLPTLKRHTNAVNMQTIEPHAPLFNTHKRVIVM
jgi:hypothetical protein